MTRNHALEIADARIAADMAQIEAIEADVSHETLIPDTADAGPLNVRFADDVHDGRDKIVGVTNNMSEMFMLYRGQLTHASGRRIEGLPLQPEGRADDCQSGQRDAIICLEHHNRPPLLRRLVWPGVALCALGLALMGVW